MIPPVGWWPDLEAQEPHVLEKFDNFLSSFNIRRTDSLKTWRGRDVDVDFGELDSAFAKKRKNLTKDVDWW